ncbi:MULTISPECIES: metal-sensitive transcriptional regulator [Francisella]|uniref:Metal-sensitive transcriptional repressor family protein n=1 Tax=Francisella frigiditurris TaxID=1542390 RepID=A0A1J0KVN6_9GAMM|nr:MULTISPECIES: metal-sensitive transcriptional regulator [Francisella]APC97676.1 metal-sensitive transcriptional repressor family protein [Francisella frigiditurris]MBK2297307.1 metal-sensitive transcriptional regulator [Francisella philomiragia]
MHPCHSKHLSKLNRVAGQVEAIKKMINENRYCVDIMTQIKAARSALKAIELAVLETHMRSCLEECHNDQDVREEKISEIMALLKKYE